MGDTTSIAAILDALAVKARGVPGVAGAAGAGTTLGVDGSPIELPGSPYAVVWLDPGTVEQGTLTTLEFDAQIRVYMSLASLPQGYGVLLGLPSLFEAAFRNDRDLGGLVDEASFVGWGRVDRETWGSVGYLVLPMRVHVLASAAADLYV